MTIDLAHFASWLASGERGISSEAIVSQLTGHRVGRRRWPDDHPHDPDDFRRCEMLLRAYPLARLTFPEAMKTRSEVWARLVEHWDELVELIESEAPGAFRGSVGIARTGMGRTPKAYALIRQLVGRAD